MTIDKGFCTASYCRIIKIADAQCTFAVSPSVAISFVKSRTSINGILPQSKSLVHSGPSRQNAWGLRQFGFCDCSIEFHPSFQKVKGSYGQLFEGF